MTTAEGSESAFLASSLSIAGVRKQRSSPDPPSKAPASPSSPTQAKTCTTAYGRTLAYVDKPGWSYSVEAARSGNARAYVYNYSPVSRAAEIAAAEQDAKAAGRGLWGAPCYGRTDAKPRR